MNNKLIKLAENTQLEKTKAQVVMEQFNNFFDEIHQFELQAKEIQITDISQRKEMRDARSIRLNLKNIRLNAEKVKKKLKENILIEGRFIDGVYNLIAGTIKPIENELMEKEKYVERLEEERKERLKNHRIQELSQYVDDTTFFDLANMNEEAYQQLLRNSKLAYEAKIEAEKKAEEERIRKEKEEEAKREKIRIENEKLKKEAIERENQIEAERKVRERKEKAQQLKLKKEKEKIEEEKRKLLQEQVAKERAEKEKAERERQLEILPDKEKLLNLAKRIDSIDLPKLTSMEALSFLSLVKEKLTSVSCYIRENSINI